MAIPELPVMLADLSRVCDPERAQLITAKPWLLPGVGVGVSNGKLLVVVDGIAGGAEQLPGYNHASVRSLLDTPGDRLGSVSMTALRDACRPSDAISPCECKDGVVECEACDGDGESECRCCGSCVECEDCDGTGKLCCPSCGGTGKVTDLCEVRPLEVSGHCLDRNQFWLLPEWLAGRAEVRVFRLCGQAVLRLHGEGWRVVVMPLIRRVLEMKEDKPIPVFALDP